MSHTPGPWKTRSHRSNVYVSGGIDDSDKELWITVQTPGDEIRAANARLIAAAPDLLAALKELVADKYLGDPINADRMKTARAAIAKATGEA